MAKYEIVIKRDFNQILQTIEQQISKNGISMKLVDESNHSLGEFSIAVRVYDKYYARNGNRTSLSITLAGNKDEIFLSAIGSGGGQGVFLNFSWGAENDMVDIVQQIVETMLS